MCRYKGEIFATQGGPKGGNPFLRERMEACGETSGRGARPFEYCLCVVEERSSGGEG